MPRVKKSESGKAARNASDTLGSRLRTLRLSLDGEFLDEVSKAAMDRVLTEGTSGRYRWKRLEDAGSASDPLDMQTALFACKKLVTKLQIPEKDVTKTLDALTAFVRAERATLPWGDKAPPWKEGESPMLRPGRPTGSRALRHTPMLLPGEDLPSNVDPATLVTPQPKPAPAIHPDVAQPAVMAILEDVRQGRLMPDTAAVVLRSLMASSCQHGLPARQANPNGGVSGLTVSYPPTAA